MEIKPPESKVFEQERERLLRTVFNAVSHDLKTPLACIIGPLEIIEQMKKELSTEQKNSLIHTALTEARKLDGLITDMLDKAKLE